MAALMEPDVSEWAGRPGSRSGSRSGLPCGLTAGLAAGRYATACLVFVLTGIFAPRPAAFFEWAHNAGLLRVTGIAYQYRHDSYQQWLLAREHRSSDT